MATQIDFANLPDCAIVRQRQIVPLLGFSASTLWRYVRSGKFPQPFSIGAHATAWRWGDVRQWLENQAEGRPQ